MSMEYIRKTYGVPAKRGGKVIINTHLGVKFDGVITGSKGARLRISINKRKGGLYHPTYNIEYLEEGE